MSNKFKIIFPYGPKETRTNDFKPEWDTTDQRAPLNDPQELFEQFVLSEEVMDELENETLSDFDDDIYDYDDRTELGEDIAMAAQADVAAAAGRLASRKKSNRTS